MMIAIRNATGIDLYLAICVRKESMRIRVTSVPPVLDEDEKDERLRAGTAQGIAGCPEGLGVKVDVRGAGLAIRAARRRMLVDRLDEAGELDGEETYLEFTLLLLN